MAKVKLSIAVIAIFFNIFFTVNANNYCKIDCRNGLRHTMCIYPQSSPSYACGNVMRIGLTNQERESIVKLHNKLRQHVARGLETRGSPGPQPAAKYMPNLQWDTELEMIAQTWVNQCNFNHDCGHVDRFNVGQNLAKSKSTIDNVEVESMVQMWYDEVERYDSRKISSFQGVKDRYGQYIGHYTQFVWAKTTKIGCGFIKYQKDGWIQFYLACNYGEAGNIPHMPVYKKN